MANFSSPVDSLHKNEVKEIIIDIEQIKESAHWQPECCIYKVPKRLRKVMEQAYTPKLVSIGPVHHDNVELKDMQKMKKGYFKEFFSRPSKDQREFASIVKKNIKKIRDCYAVEISLPEEEEDLVKMILLDSIFIIELFLRDYERTITQGDCESISIQRDYILNKPWLKSYISQDLILLENQLPFFILNHLYDLIPDKHEPFLKLACNYFFGGDIELSFDENKVKHFTDLQRYFYYPPKQDIGGSIEHLHSATKLDTAGLLFKKLKPQKLEENSLEEKSLEENSATKLNTAGLQFKKWKPQTPEEISLEESRRLLDIQFEKPSEICLCDNWSWPLHCLPCLEKLSCLEDLQTRLVIPQLVVTDVTEELFRNLMALEQCHYPLDAYICNYILLLDLLINSKEDVELLVEESIIVNSLGSDEAVANMVNKLGQEITEVTSYYFNVADAANKHYLSPWNQNMASLKKVYFRDIWRGTATVVGVLVLVMGLFSFLKPFVIVGSFERQ